LNDSGNSERLLSRHGRHLMFVPEVGRYFYTGLRWSAQLGDQKWALAADKTAVAMRMREGPELEAALAGADDKWLRAFRDWATRSGDRARLDAMQAVSEPFKTTRLDALDTDPLLFNVQNGTLQLGCRGKPSEVRLRKHVPRDLISRIAPVGYDESATCPRFRDFMDEVLPDRAVQRWMQKFLGYSLTGEAREHILLMLLGRGRNGKGTLVKLLCWLYGDYAATISFASLTADARRRGAEASPDIARLPGIRLLFSAEPSKGVRLDDGRIKELTGEDRQAARHLNREFFEFDPQFKLVIQANNRPRITDKSEGMWERVRLVPFDVFVPAERRDLTLIDKLKTEGPGVLNWLVDGYRLWRDEGLIPPAAIKVATKTYRDDSDEFGQFLVSAAKPNPTGAVASTQFYRCYQGWAKAMDYQTMTPTKFGKELTDRGYTPELRGSDRLTWRIGLTWRDDNDIDWEWDRN
jgi:putative DNA primase/helicase